MTNLTTHIQICQALKKERLLSNQNVRIIWHIAKCHEQEVTMEDFIKAISEREPEIVESIGKKPCAKKQ